MFNFFVHNPEKIMPTIMILCSIASSIVYFYKGSMGQGLYWVSASMLTYSVTYLCYK